MTNQHSTMHPFFPKFEAGSFCLAASTLHEKLGLICSVANRDETFTLYLLLGRHFIFVNDNYNNNYTRAGVQAFIYSYKDCLSCG